MAMPKEQQRNENQQNGGNGDRRGLPEASCRRLRQLRKALGLTLKGMEERTGLTYTHLGQIEQGKKMPSIPALLNKIGPAYGVPNPSDLLVEKKVVTKRVVVANADDRLQILRVGEDRELSYEALAERVEDENISWSFATLKGNCDSGSVDHPGEELIFVLSGSLELTVGKAKHALEPRSLAHYQSQQPHSLKNKTDAPARMLVIRYPAHPH